MKLLLDTNALVRWMELRPFPKEAERVLRRPTTERVISIVTAWEIALKPSLGYRPTDIEEAIEALNAELLPIKFPHLGEFARLPFRDDHRDPFDRMLIAQALSESLHIVTGDPRFPSYKGLRVLWD